MIVLAFHPILYVDDQYAERDFFELFGFRTVYEGPEFPGFLAIESGTARFGLSARAERPVDEAFGGVRWQFLVDDVNTVVAVCDEVGLNCEVVVELGGDAHRASIAKVRSPGGVLVWFEGPNELAAEG